MLSSQEALLVGNPIPYNVDTVDSSSMRSSNRSPVSVNETFWVPTTSQRHSSTFSEAIATTSAGLQTTIINVDILLMNKLLDSELKI